MDNKEKNSAFEKVEKIANEKPREDKKEKFSLRETNILPGWPGSQCVTKPGYIGAHPDCARPLLRR